MTHKAIRKGWEIIYLQEKTDDEKVWKFISNSQLDQYLGMT